MRKEFNIFILVFGLIAFASCSQEKDLPSPDQSMDQQGQSAMAVQKILDQPIDTTRNGLYIDKKVSNTNKNNLSGSSKFVKAP